MRVNAILTTKGSVEALTKAYEEQKQAALDATIVGSNDVWNGFKANTGASSDPYEMSNNTKADQLMLLEFLKENITNAEQLKLLLGDSLGKVGEYGSQEWADNYPLRTAYESLKPILAELGLEYNGLAKNSEENIKMLMDNASLIEAKYRTMVSALNSETSNVKPILNAMLETDYSFQTLGANVQDAVKSITAGFDFDFFSQFDNKESMYAWVSENLIAPLSDPSTSAEMQKAITTLFDPANMKLPADQYKQVIESALSSLPEDLQEQVRVFLKFDFVTEDMKEQLQDKLGDINTSSLSIEQIKIVLNPDFEFKGNSLEQLKNQINDTLNPPSLDTFSTSLLDIVDNLTKLESGFSSLSAAQDELSTSGGFTASTFQTLMDNDLLQYLDSVDGKLQINTQRFLTQNDYGYD